MKYLFLFLGPYAKWLWCGLWHLHRKQSSFVGCWCGWRQHPETCVECKEEFPSKQICNGLCVDCHHKLTNGQTHPYNMEPPV